MQSFYTARLGLKSQQQRMDEIASNIANVETIAYKSQGTDFVDTLNLEIAGTPGMDDTGNFEGTGARLSSTYRDYSVGTPLETGCKLDFIIKGDGFFTVQGKDGNIYYTRNGAFTLSTEPDGEYLATPEGSYVLDTDGNRILLPDPSDVTVSEAGLISSGGLDIATLKNVTFINKDGLSLNEDGCYSMTDVSGGEIPSDAPIQQGYIESSNVSLTGELTQMVLAQRTFSLASKALSTWYDMESAANNLRT